MLLKKIKSRKHPGAIFLKVADSKDDFWFKIYPCSNAEERADSIRMLYANEEEKEQIRLEK